METLRPSAIVATVGNICPLVELVQRLGLPALWGAWAGRWRDASKNFLFMDLSVLSFFSCRLRPHEYRNQCWDSRTREVTEPLHSHWKPFCLASRFACDQWPQLLRSMSLCKNITEQMVSLEWKEIHRLQFHQGKQNHQNTNPRVSMTLIKVTIASLSIVFDCSV